MKQLVIYLSCIVLSIFVACNKNGSKSAHSSNVLMKKSVTNDSGFRFPNGTVFEEKYTSDGGIESINFQLPTNSVMYGITSSNSIISGSTGTLTCKCSGSGGCKPFTAGGNWGCMMDGCSECKGTVTKLGANQELDLFFIKRGESNGFLELSALDKSKPIITPEEWLNLPFIRTEDFNNPEIQEALDNLNSYITNHSGDKKSKVSIPYQIDGKKMLIDVPYSVVEDGMLYTMSAGSGSVSCSGSCSQGKCVKKTAGLGQVTYCDGCESGCSLTMTK